VSDEYSAAAGVALYVTENGAAYDDVPVIEGGETRVHDVERVEFVEAHLAAILDALDKGIDVRGYFYWSLLDNFEWEDGWLPTFGLVAFDRETFDRRPKPSSRLYGEIARGNAVTADQRAAHPWDMRTMDRAR
jgi:beta-glucosidase